MKLSSTVLFTLALTIASVSSRAADAETAIKDALNAQVEAWNRGDVATFVTTYAEDCTFVGKQILEGRASLLARYRKSYPSPEAMGKLTFQNLRVRPLDKDVAVVTGEWHIDRASTSGGAVGGVFSLVLQLRKGRWEIVLDHTT